MFGHHRTESSNTIFENRVLCAGAQRKSVARVIVRWLTQRGVVAIPKSEWPERIAENVDVFDVTLTSDDMTAIAALDTKTSAFFDHRDPAIVRMLGTVKRPT